MLTSAEFLGGEGGSCLKDDKLYLYEENFDIFFSLLEDLTNARKYSQMVCYCF